MSKKGVIIILYSFVIICIFFIFIFIILFQLNIQIIGIRKDLFYIVQNSFLALNKDEIVYNNVIIDECILKDKITNLLNLNYPRYKLSINNLYYNNGYVYIEINYRFVPINTLFLKESNILIKEKVKLKEITYE